MVLSLVRLVRSSPVSVVVDGTVVFDSLLDLLYKIGAVMHEASMDKNTKTIRELAVFRFMPFFEN